MALELVPLTVGVEQSFTLTYNDTDYTFDLKFSDYGNYWYFNIYKGLNEDGGKAYFLCGEKLIVGVNIFEGKEYLGFGGLALIDTKPDSIVSLDPKNDIGDRLQLFRNI